MISPEDPFYSALCWSQCNKVIKINKSYEGRKDAIDLSLFTEGIIL